VIGTDCTGKIQLPYNNDHDGLFGFGFGFEKQSYAPWDSPVCGQK